MKEHGQRYAQQREVPKQSKIIGISEERCLLLDNSVKHPQALLMSGVGVRPSEAKFGLQATEDLHHCRISTRDVCH